MGNANGYCVNVFPARAGMILGDLLGHIEPLSIPRESGDDPYADHTPADGGEYSPRERG